MPPLVSSACSQAASRAAALAAPRRASAAGSMSTSRRQAVEVIGSLQTADPEVCRWRGRSRGKSMTSCRQ
ncbi:hypothetical protein [Streptomyces scopuliridis]|uniref:hypothetical protein n=1 Tax=Streptomyces scopuliridis TaxID=452529 RepID=UPI0034309A6A